MYDHVTVTGNVGATPKYLQTQGGLVITSFRLASTRRRFDEDRKEWIDAETNWYTVNTYRQLAKNVAASIETGQRVVVTGRLRVRAWEKDDKHGVNVEIEADAVGPDLLWGTTVWKRNAGATAIPREEDTFSEIEALEAGAAVAEPDGVAVPF